MVIKLNTKQMEILSKKFSDCLLRLVKMNIHNKILEEFRRRATMKDGEYFYFDLDDSSDIRVYYDIGGNWGCVKTFIDDHKGAKSIKLNSKGRS